MTRRLLNVLTAVSLLAFASVLLIWLRSYAPRDFMALPVPGLRWNRDRVINHRNPAAALRYAAA